MDRSRAIYAWASYAAHTRHAPGVAARLILRKAVILLPPTAGFVFSLAGEVLGWGRQRGFVDRRDSRRLRGCEYPIEGLPLGKRNALANCSRAR